MQIIQQYLLLCNQWFKFNDSTILLLLFSLSSYLGSRFLSWATLEVVMAPKKRKAGVKVPVKQSEADDNVETAKSKRTKVQKMDQKFIIERW